MSPSPQVDESVLLPAYLAQLRDVRHRADEAIQAGTIVACEEALDAIADIACDGHDDDEEGA